MKRGQSIHNVHAMLCTLFESCLCKVPALVTRKFQLFFYFFGIVQLVFNFIESSPKRHAVFERFLKQTTIKLNTLISFSETKWACCSEAFSVIYLHLNKIVRVIEEYTASNSDSKVWEKGKGICCK